MTSITLPAITRAGTGIDYSAALKVNADGSVDLYFGPAPAGFENNWVQTILGKGEFMILRLYGPLEPWFNQTSRGVAERPLSPR